MAFENWTRFVNQTKADLERQKQAEELRKVSQDKRTTAKNYKPYNRRSQHNH